MSKKLAILLVVAAFLVGVTLGFLVSATLGFKIYENEVLRAENEIVLSSAIRNEGGINDSVNILNLLRTNNTTEAIEELERNLDIELIGLNTSMSNAAKSRFDQSFLRAIQEAKEYRLQFSHKSDEPWIGEQVSNAFLRANPSASK